MARTIYCRLEAPRVQTAKQAREQEETGLIRGSYNKIFGVRAPYPSVDAYRRRLALGERGVEFTTTATPDRGTPPGRARWGGDGRERPGLELSGDEAILRVTIVRNTQV